MIARVVGSLKTPEFTALLVSRRRRITMLSDTHLLIRVRREADCQLPSLSAFRNLVPCWFHAWGTGPGRICDESREVPGRLVCGTGFTGTYTLLRIRLLYRRLPVSIRRTGQPAWRVCRREEPTHSLARSCKSNY